MEIKDMKPGDTGYTVSWAFCVDEYGDLWARNTFNVEAHFGGTNNTEVSRLDDGKLAVRFQAKPTLAEFSRHFFDNGFLTKVDESNLDKKDRIPWI